MGELAINSNGLVKHSSELARALELVSDGKINLPDRDLTIIRKANEKLIRDYTDQELINWVKVLSKGISDDYGIPEPKVDENSKTNFFLFLKNMYQNLTIQEVKLAFEYALVNELDEWLPKDKYGKPDANSYNLFNKKFYAKILSAYQSRKEAAMYKMNIALPSHGIKTSEAEKLQMQDEFFSDVIEIFRLFKNNVSIPNVRLSQAVLNLLVDMGYAPKSLSVDRDYVAKVLKDIQSGKHSYSFIEKSIMTEMLGEDKVHDELLSTAFVQKRKETILESFKGMVDLEIDFEKQINEFRKG